MKQEVEKNVLAEYIWQLRIICETHHNKGKHFDGAKKKLCCINFTQNSELTCECQ